MYIFIKSEEQKKSIIKKLEEMGFEKSRWSCPENEIVAIGTFVDPIENEKFYIFFNMPMVTGEHNWAVYRTKADNEKEFFSSLENMIKVLYEKWESFKSKHNLY